MEIVPQDHQGGIAASEGSVGHSVRGDPVKSWNSFDIMLERITFEELRPKPRPTGDKVVEDLRSKLPRPTSWEGKQ